MNQSVLTDLSRALASASRFLDVATEWAPWVVGAFVAVAVCQAIRVIQEWSR